MSKPEARGSHTDAPPGLEPGQREVLQSLADHWRSTGSWSRAVRLRDTYEEKGLKFDDILHSIPQNLWGIQHVNGDERVTLSVAGLEQTKDARPDIEPYLQLVRLAATRYINNPEGNVVVARVDLEEILGPTRREDFARLGTWYKDEWRFGSTTHVDGDWQLFTGIEIVALADIQSAWDAHARLQWGLRLKSPGPEHLAIMRKIYRSWRASRQWPRVVPLVIANRKDANVLQVLKQIPREMIHDFPLTSPHVHRQEVQLSLEGIAVVAEHGEPELFVRMLREFYLHFKETYGEQRITAEELALRMGCELDEVRNMGRFFMTESRTGVRIYDEGTSWAAEEHEFIKQWKDINTFAEYIIRKRHIENADRLGLFETNPFEPQGLASIEEKPHPASAEECGPDEVMLKDVNAQELPAAIRDIDLLIMTAVGVELEAVLRAMKAPARRKAILRCHIGQETYYVGRFGAVKAVATMCAPGAIGRDAALLASSKAIQKWRPGAVVMVGIAFGNDPAKQQIADVLVSSQVISYEPQRVGVDVSIPRGPIADASPVLLNRFRHVLSSWRFQRADGSRCRILVGPILSGEKLVDNPIFKQSLLEQFPQAIGGEMEGAGLYAAASRAEASVEWIIVKAICDWADGAKAKEYQSLAATAATSLVEHVFSNPNVLDGIARTKIKRRTKARGNSRNPRTRGQAHRVEVRIVDAAHVESERAIAITVGLANKSRRGDTAIRWALGLSEAITLSPSQPYTNMVVSGTDYWWPTRVSVGADDYEQGVLFFRVDEEAKQILQHEPVRATLGVEMMRYGEVLHPFELFSLRTLHKQDTARTLADLERRVAEADERSGPLFTAMNIIKRQLEQLQQAPEGWDDEIARLQALHAAALRKTKGPAD